MLTITINPSTFAYYCSEATIYPAFVLEHPDLKVHFSGKDNKRDIEKLKQFISEEF